MLGAHYDHLGHGGRGSSLARAGEETKVHPGRRRQRLRRRRGAGRRPQRLKDGPRGRHVAFAFWSGEEAGLLGSAAFTAKPPVPLDQLAAYFNFDMVGRLRDDSAAGAGRRLEPGAGPALADRPTSSRS